jgi:hypothetical protein
MLDQNIAQEILVFEILAWQRPRGLLGKTQEPPREPTISRSGRIVAGCFAHIEGMRSFVPYNDGPIQLFGGITPSDKTG